MGWSGRAGTGWRRAPAAGVTRHARRGVVQELRFSYGNPLKAILLAGLLAGAGFAQSFTEPPPLLRLNRRPGVNGAAIRQYADAGAQVNVVGMTSITGPAETWLIEPQNSFEGIEEVDKAVGPLVAVDEPLSNEILAASRTMIAVYRPGFSYRPEQAIQAFPKARYFQVSLYRIRPGTEAEFVELVKSRRILRDSINLDRPEMAYQVISGAPSGTYLFLAPLASLKVLDEGLAKARAYAGGIAASAKAGEFTREHLLFRVEPKMSWVSDEFASADPEFWRPKAQ